MKKELVRIMPVIGFIFAFLTAIPVYGENGDVVMPKKQDILHRETLRGSELGGELDRRIRELVYKNFMVIDLDHDWLDHFRNRTDRKGAQHIYYGIGKVIDAGSLFAQYTGDPQVTARTNYLIKELRKTRDPNGYLGFWKTEPNNEQNNINWILHEQEYINLALVRNYRTTGNPASLQDAKIMADYIMRSFPVNDKGIHFIKPGISIAGITESFLELYRVTGEEKYLKFAENLQYEPHWYYEPWSEWSKMINQRKFHLYVMMSHMYPETELYRLTGDSTRLLKSRWLQQALLEKDHGALLVTGSSSEGEHFTYNQKGNGSIEESCVTAYLLRLLDSLMRIDGDMRLGNVMERTIFNALFAAQSPDGRRICYFTPFTGKRIFQNRDTFCCNGNFRRGIAEIPAKVFYRTSEDGIVLNLYTAANKLFEVKGQKIRLREKTDYPNSGNVKLFIDPEKSLRFSLRFRTPAWCEKMTLKVNNEKPIPIVPSLMPQGYYELTRSWEKGDTVELSMPMNWRFIRGRACQKGYAALLRGPVLFCIGEAQNPNLVKNKDLLKKIGQLRELVIDPASLGAPEPDDSIRPNGLKVKAKAWLNPNRTGEKIDVVLNEFIDPSSLDVYFRIPDENNPAPVRLMDDELLFEPRTFQKLKIVSAFWGLEYQGDLKKLMDNKGPVLADPARNYIAPQGRTDRNADHFPDGQGGFWSFRQIKDRSISPNTSDNEEILQSRYKVYATPLGFAYGQNTPDSLGFIAPHDPSDRQNLLWKEHFTEKVMDQVIPESERNDYLYLHPTATPKGALVMRWKPNRELTGKMPAVDLTLLSRTEGNGVTLHCFSVDKKGSKTTLFKINSQDGIQKENAIINFVFVPIPEKNVEYLDFMIDNNGNHFSDTAAVKIRIISIENSDCGTEVTKTLQSIAAGKMEVNFAPFALKMQSKTSNKTNTFKIKLYDTETGEMIYRQIPVNRILKL